MTEINELYKLSETELRKTNSTDFQTVMNEYELYNLNEKELRKRIEDNENIKKMFTK